MNNHLLKTEIRVAINIALLTLVFAIFTLIITLNANILKENVLLALQLVLAIPLLMSSALSNLKLVTLQHAKKIDMLAHISFLVGYSFLINTIGILLALFVSLPISILFFAANIVMALIYSFILTSYDKKEIKIRLLEDAYFFISVVILGILPALGN